MAAEHSKDQRPARVDPLWHTLGGGDVVDRLRSDPAAGLSQQEASLRLAQHSPNVLESRGERPWPAMLLAQFTDFMIVVLLAAAIVAGVVGEPEDSIAIVVIVVLNAWIGFAQEHRAAKAMAALRRLAPDKARVVREGELRQIDAADLVPGDIVHLEAGDIVPGDIRLIEAARLQAEEAALTGESIPIEKGTAVLDDDEAPLGDRTGMVYKGTLITRGRARGVVVATGMRTELGHVAAMLDAGEGRTPLQKRLAQFGRRLALAVLAICALLFAVGWLRGEPPLAMFLTAVSLAVAAIPEALPAVATIALALGAARMAKRNALVRRLPAVETLGSVTYICTDKTGTLTENRMRVEALHADGTERVALPLDSGPPWRDLGLAMSLCNDAGADGNGTGGGDPTERALLEAVSGPSRAAYAARHPRLAEIPFDADRARMSTFHRDGDGVLMLVKGAPESVLPRCTRRSTVAGDVAMDPALASVAGAYAAAGQRVLACAVRRLPGLPGTLEPEATERDLVFAGFVALRDPPRAGAASAVAACRAAGITPVMLTGDHPATALAIATQLGIADPSAPVLTGRELAQRSPAAFVAEVTSVRVYARINPEQKIRIVQALQAAGEFVAMTGDGVNDAPALRQADIGVAMGRIGTDVAREAASMTLLDDNFATIVAAVHEGRRIFDNIRKFVRYTMTSNSGEIWTLFLAPFVGLPVPLLPVHILWINLVTDGLPGLALAVEPAERRAMRRPPRPPRESLFARGLWQHVLWVGLLMGGVSLLTQSLALRAGDWPWQTMVFTVLTLSQMGHALAVRSEDESLFAIGLWSNRPLLFAVVSTLALQLAVVYVPWLQPHFHTQALEATELGICFGLATTVFFAVETEKLVRRWRRRGSIGC